jgi:thiol:disulfide interchange protein DsbC
MKNFLLLSAIYLFSPRLSAAEDVADLRRALTAKMPQVAIGEIRKLPYVDLYEIQANGVNVFYADSKGEVALFGNLVNLQTRARLSEQRKQELMVVYFSALPRAQIESRLNTGGKS